MKPKNSIPILKKFKNSLFRDSFEASRMDDIYSPDEDQILFNKADVKKETGYFKNITKMSLSIKATPKMKTCKLVILTNFIIALIIFSYIFYKQRSSLMDSVWLFYNQCLNLMDSVWLFYNQPMFQVGLGGGSDRGTAPGLEGYPVNGRSLETLFQDMRPFTLQTDYDYLQEYIQTGGINITQLSMLDVGGGEWMNEKFYLTNIPLREPECYPPIQDIRMLPNESYCRVHVFDEKTEYAVGDKVGIRIDMYNGYNQRLIRGGDTVHVWVTEREKNAALATDVIDLNNGSYYTSIPIMWQGTQEVQISVRYPRELIRALVYTRKVMKSLRYVAAGFLTRNVSEATLCLPFPMVPGYPKLCNFSQRNYGHPWFCGYPRKKGLHCSDWKILRDMEFPKPLPLTAVEKEALEIPVTLPVPRILTQKVQFEVTSGQLTTPPLCDKKNFTHTWVDRAPHGYYMNKTWIPSTCTFPVISLPAWASCLGNTTVILAGDSNLLMWMHRIQTRVKCDVTKIRSSNHWHTPLICRRADINFSMIWQLHGYPEHPTSTHWADITHFRAVCRRIDSIPAHGKYVVIVHLFIHFSIHHSVVLLNRLQCIRRAIGELLNRNPTAKVFIRAPFTARMGWNPIFGGEMVTPFFLSMLRHEFQSLYDRIILLNMWDMTLAGENDDYHPDAWIDNQMAGIVLNHICNN